MNHVIPLKCPSCGANIQVPEGATRVTCGYCGGQHLLNLTPAPAQPAQPAAAIRPRVKADASITIKSTPESLRITRRWFTPATLLLAVFALFWDGFLIFFYSTLMRSGAPGPMLLFPLLHVAVGVYLTYTVLAGFLNRTEVELTREKLEIWFDPLPWPGEKSIAAAELKQLYCKERVRRSKNGPRYSYQLMAVKRDDEEIKLLSGLSSPETAAFFEQEIERWLRIDDQPVVGEYK